VAIVRAANVICGGVQEVIADWYSPKPSPQSFPVPRNCQQRESFDFRRPNGPFMAQIQKIRVDHPDPMAVNQPWQRHRRWTHVARRMPLHPNACIGKYLWRFLPPVEKWPIVTMLHKNAPRLSKSRAEGRIRQKKPAATTPIVA
jgi:hypothetical protein